LGYHPRGCPQQGNFAGGLSRSLFTTSQASQGFLTSDIAHYLLNFPRIPSRLSDLVEFEKQIADYLFSGRSCIF
jgi:hypothetical protein